MRDFRKPICVEARISEGFSPYFFLTEVGFFFQGER